MDRPELLPHRVPAERVRLTAYSGEASDLPADVLQNVLDRIADGTFALGPTHAYRLDQIHEAHRDMENNAVSGKLVVLTSLDSLPLTSEQPGSVDESR